MCSIFSISLEKPTKLLNIFAEICEAKNLDKFFDVTVVNVKKRLKENQNVPQLFLKNGSSSASFLFIFSLFEQTIEMLQQINVKKCPSSIRCWDLISQPLEYQSSPITTRPGLPPSISPNFDLTEKATNSISNKNYRILILSLLRRKSRFLTKKLLNAEHCSEFVNCPKDTIWSTFHIWKSIQQSVSTLVPYTYVLLR